MTRKTHVLSPTGERPYPQLVVSVQCKVKQRYLGEADDVGQLALSEWYAQCGKVVNAGIEWGEESHGTTAIGWWDWLAERTMSSLVVHIYSWQAREIVAALGLWDCLADGSYTLKGADPYQLRDLAPNRVERDSGYIILEGPPTVIAFADATSHCRYVWLDPQNYGVKEMTAYIDELANSDVKDKSPVGELWIEGTGPQVLCYAVGDWLDSYYRAVSSLHLGGPEHTAASQAMQAFRYHYMQHPIEIHDSTEITKMERAALYGGRCECNYIGTLNSGPVPGELVADEQSSPCVRYNVGPMYYLDVNALYPAVAINAHLPVKLAGIVKHCGMRKIADVCKVAGVIADVRIETEYPCVPCRLDDRTIYPVGEFNTTLCGPELMLASSLGARIIVTQAALYQTAPIYRGMVERLWHARRMYRDAGKKAMETCVKGVMNAALGKWAQRRHHWEDCPNVLPLRPYMQWWQRSKEGTEQQYRSIGWNVQRMCDSEEEHNDTFPAITAYIYSLARVRLWHLLQVAGDGNVYYMDTDSMICNQLAYNSLAEQHYINSLCLGSMKIVKQPSKVRLIGRQAYELDGVLTISGARGEVHRHGDAYVEILRAPPIGYYLVHDDPPGLDRYVARVRVTRDYNQGHVREDGVVEPIRFGPG